MHTRLADLADFIAAPSPPGPEPITTMLKCRTLMTGYFSTPGNLRRKHPKGRERGQSPR